MDIWNKLTTETQEKAVSRKKFSDLELDEKEKFKNAHNASLPRRKLTGRTKDRADERAVLRPCYRQHRTYFIGYSRYWKVTKLMLENMLKNGDYLLTFSGHPVRPALLHPVPAAA